MTDLNERFAAMLDGEPTAPHDLDRVVAAGRHSLRRRHAITAVAGTAGTAAVTAAILVPIAVNGSSGSDDRITVGTQPTTHAQPRCKIFYKSIPAGHEAIAIRKLAKAHPHVAEIKGGKVHNGKQFLTVVDCPPGAAKAGTPGFKSEPAPTPSSTLAPYHYSGDPQTIANSLGAELTKQVKALGFSIIYSSPFAQESSTLEKGHPTYFDGSVDVQLPDGPANIGVQVTHEVTQLVPFDGSCKAPDCTQTTLPDGSIVQTSTVHAGTGGGTIDVLEIHHPDGLVVEAQEANYAFGPEATRARGSLPLTGAQLSALAEDPGFTF
jgi:hypothetical protein